MRVLNLRRVDLDVLVRKMRYLKLPFEYLVRSVWIEGPEMEYDRVKASLEALLQGEVVRRRRQAESMVPGCPTGDERAPTPRVGATLRAPTRPALAGQAAGAQAAPTPGGEVLLDPTRPSSAAAGTRLGLLTFHGVDAPAHLVASRPSSAKRAL